MSMISMGRMWASSDVSALVHDLLIAEWTSEPGSGSVLLEGHFLVLNNTHIIEFPSRSSVLYLIKTVLALEVLIPVYFNHNIPPSSSNSHDLHA